MLKLKYSKFSWCWLCFLMLTLHGKVSWAQNDPIGTQIMDLKSNVVGIRATVEGIEEKGFGFITAEQNGLLYIATAAHVVRGPDKNRRAEKIFVKFRNDIRWHVASFMHHWDNEDLALLQFDLALLQLPKPIAPQWQSNCADLNPGNSRQVRFIGLNKENVPSWDDPGQNGIIFKENESFFEFSIGTVLPGTSGAPLITECGIVGMITKSDGALCTALKLTQIKKLFSENGQYPYFALQGCTEQMVLITGGTFRMGCTPEQGSDCNDNEKPHRPVTLKDFHLSKYEVTVREFKTFVDATKYRTSAEQNNTSRIWNGSDWVDKAGVNWRFDVAGNRRPDADYNHPVIHVSWDDAVKYCEWLEEKTRKPYRLPTEAEWEYAARGGDESKHYRYAGSNNRTEVAWYKDNSGDKTHPVGQKKANELGLYDMSGNVWELCQDWYGNYNNVQDNPTGNPSGIEKATRGGCWDNADPKSCRVSDRGAYPKGKSADSMGFRVAY